MTQDKIKTQKVSFICPKCGQKSHEKSSFSVSGKSYKILSCSHILEETKVTPIVKDLNEIILHDGRKLYPFQVEGVRFAEASNFRCQISDEMGLGKTIQAVGALHLHYEDLKPALVIVKASLTFQWLREYVSGTGRINAQILDTKTPPIPGMGVYITSFDSLPPRQTKKGTTEGLVSKLKPLGIKTIVIDECQMLKNHAAARTNAIRELVRNTAPRKLGKGIPLQRKKIEVIAKDLIRYHGLEGRFELIFTNLGSKVLGLTECRSSKDGIIVGKIYISAAHAETSDESEIIETILHEIAHAITPGAGHKPIWSETSIAIGGNGKAFAYCQGTTEPDIQEPTVKHIISLSGTPIKNNAIEYFPILNLLYPEKFWNRDRFIAQEVDYYWDGQKYKAGGLRDPLGFQEKTKNFIIRRTRSEVLPDLPAIQRDFKFYKMGEEVTKAYNRKVKLLSDFMDEAENGEKDQFQVQGELIGHLQILRHITGLAKIEPTIEYVTEYFEEAENGDSKITIFHHHKDVGAILTQKLVESFGADVVIQMTASDDSETRMKKIESFEKDGKILIAPTLACGEGINLQFCSHAIILEREWNPANEEQAEGRFSRIGSKATSILVNYPTATETIDEFFAELVERKREIVSSTLDGTAQSWNESIVMKELAEIVVSKWRMK